MYCNIGHRTLNYQHSLNYRINEDWSLQNIAVYEPGYDQELPNTYFLRNTLSYAVGKHIAVHASAGIKTPGTFATLSTQLAYSKGQVV